MEPRWSWLLTQWNFEPSVVLGLTAFTAAYLYACGYQLPFGSAGRTRREPLCSPSQLRWFLASDVVLVIALLSPLDYVGDEFLFSAHMIQHLLLASVWPPLLLLGLPQQLVAPAFCTPVVGRALRWLTFPAIAFIIFNVDITIWHLTAWYDLTLQNEAVHVVEHLSFMVAGVLMWWPVLSPIRSQRLSFGMQELYLFANLFPMMALGIFFTFWQHPLYAPYINAPRLWGIPALTDQQVGGLIMWMPGDLPYAIAMAATLMFWIERGDPAEQRRKPTLPLEGHGV